MKVYVLNYPGRHMCLCKEPFEKDGPLWNWPKTKDRLYLHEGSESREIRYLVDTYCLIPNTPAMIEL